MGLPWRGPQFLAHLLLWTLLLILNMSNSFMLVWPPPVSGQHYSPFPVGTPVAGGSPLHAGTGIPFVRVWAHRCIRVCNLKSATAIGIRVWSQHRCLEVMSLDTQLAPFFEGNPSQHRCLVVMSLDTQLAPFLGGNVS